MEEIIPKIERSPTENTDSDKLRPKAAPEAKMKQDVDEKNHVDEKKDMDDLIACTTKLNLGETENRLEGVIPSKCVESIWVWAKTSEEIYSRLDDEAGGKWLVFLNEMEKDSEGLTALDKAWALINQATLNGTFYQAKASTAVKEAHAAQNDPNGVIVIYTKDFDDLDDVLKTAVNIATILQDLLPIRYALRYKTNAATDARLYPSQNCKNVTMYRYTQRFGLQERDGPAWIIPPLLKSHLDMPRLPPPLKFPPPNRGRATFKSNRGGVARGGGRHGANPN